MSVSDDPFDGDVLGLHGPVEARVCFVYDRRGPRTSPAIEVQAWVSPSAVGTPHESPFTVGVQSLGIAVGDLGAATTAATALGAHVVGAAAASELFGAATTTLRDPSGITFDLVQSSDTGTDGVDGESRIAHLRINCRDLGASVSWYEGLGFTVTRRKADFAIDAAVLGDGGRASMVELVLPDEPMRLLLVHWLDSDPGGAHYPVANHRGIYRAALGVDDTRVAVRALEASGVAIVRQPELIELQGTPVPDMWIAFLADPNGVPIELVERPRNAFR